MESNGNQFLIGGIPAVQIAGEFGTPVYVYNGDKIESQYKRLISAFSGVKFKVKYACKANTNINILRLLNSLGCGLDTVSINEVKLGLMAGFPKQEIVFTPNSVAISEIFEAAEMGVRLNIDNLNILEEFGKKYGDSIPVCIRINPHIVAGGNKKIQTAHLDSKFGISIHQIDKLLKIVTENNILVESVHLHSGSDIKDVESFIQGLDALFEVAKRFKGIRYIDFGSGFKVSYKEGDAETNIEELGARLSEKFQAFCKSYGRELELWCEPGKFLVSASGFLLTTANVIKETAAETIIVGVNSGLNHLIRPMMYDAYHEILNVSNPGAAKHTYSVVGNICETDTFGVNRTMDEVREGDIIAFRNAGAYGFSMSSNYNSRFRPAEVLVYKGKSHLIRKREVFEDLIAKQVVVEL